MQVGQLKEIIKLLKITDENYTDECKVYLDDGIFDLEKGDISLILENKDNKNIAVLIKFLVWWSNEELRDEFYESLGFEENDSFYKNVVVEKILTSEDIKLSYNIYWFFDQPVPLNSEEWVTYLDYIPVVYDFDIYNELLNILDFIDNRKLEAAEKALILLPSTSIDCESIKDGLTILDTDQEKLDFLHLCSIGYECNSSIELILKMREEKHYQVKEKIMKYLVEVYSNFPMVISTNYEIIVELSRTFENDEEWKPLTKTKTLSSIKYIHDNIVIFSKVTSLTFKELVIKLKDYSIDELEKLANIFKLGSFYEEKDKESIIELILSEDGKYSLDYIYNVYLQKEQSKIVVKEPLKPVVSEEIRLLTVYELLLDGTDAELVLDGFGEKEEVTQKTLIRSFAYKGTVE